MRMGTVEVRIERTELGDANPCLRGNHGDKLSNLDLRIFSGCIFFAAYLNLRIFSGCIFFVAYLSSRIFFAAYFELAHQEDIHSLIRTAQLNKRKVPREEATELDPRGSKISC